MLYYLAVDRKTLMSNSQPILFLCRKIIRLQRDTAKYYFSISQCILNKYLIKNYIECNINSKEYMGYDLKIIYIKHPLSEKGQTFRQSLWFQICTNLAIFRKNKPEEYSKQDYCNCVCLVRMYGLMLMRSSSLSLLITARDYACNSCQGTKYLAFYPVVSMVTHLPNRAQRIRCVTIETRAP